MPPSSRGLGHLPFTEATGIRIPLGVFSVKIIKYNFVKVDSICSTFFANWLILLHVGGLLKDWIAYLEKDEAQ